MKKHSLIIIILSFLVIHNGTAQDYLFKVLVNKGKNEVKTPGGWQPLKVGASLTKNDQIRITDNAYVGLVHTSGKPLELKKAENVKVADLAERVAAGSSVLTKYTDFILSSNTATNNKLNATGAVHRGGDNIEVFLPTSKEFTVTYKPSVIISWNSEGLTGPFTVTFISLFGDELKKIETPENFVTINLEDPDFQNEDNVIVKVVSKKDRKESRDEFMLKKLSRSDRERIKKFLDELSPSTEETAINKYYLAGFYESHNLLIDASTALQEAIRLAPEVDAYKIAYQDFLLRTGIKTSEKK